MTLTIIPSPAISKKNPNKNVRVLPEKWYMLKTSLNFFNAKSSQNNYN
jgi:hypothetical protein